MSRAHGRPGRESLNQFLKAFSSPIAAYSFVLAAENTLWRIALPIKAASMAAIIVLLVLAAAALPDAVRKARPRTALAMALGAAALLLIPEARVGGLDLHGPQHYFGREKATDEAPLSDSIAATGAAAPGLFAKALIGMIADGQGE